MSNKLDNICYCRVCGEIMKLTRAGKRNGKKRNPYLRCQKRHTKYVSIHRSNNKEKYREASLKCQRKNYAKYYAANKRRCNALGAKCWMEISNAKTFANATLRRQPWDLVDDDFLMNTDLRGQKLAEYLGRTLRGIHHRRRFLRDNNIKSKSAM